MDDSKDDDEESGSRRGRASELRREFKTSRAAVNLLNFLDVPEPLTLRLWKVVGASAFVYGAAACVVCLMVIYRHASDESVSKVTQSMMEAAGKRHDIECRSLTLANREDTFDDDDGVQWTVTTVDFGIANAATCRSEFNAADVQVIEVTTTSPGLPDTPALREGVFAACYTTVDGRSFGTVSSMTRAECRSLFLNETAFVNNVVVASVPRCGSCETALCSTETAGQGCYNSSDDAEAIWRNSSVATEYCDIYDDMPPYSCTYKKKMRSVEAALAAGWALADFLITVIALSCAFVSFVYFQCTSAKSSGVKATFYKFALDKKAEDADTVEKLTACLKETTDRNEHLERRLQDLENRFQLLSDAAQASWTAPARRKIKTPPDAAKKRMRDTENAVASDAAVAHKASSTSVACGPCTFMYESKD